MAALSPAAQDRLFFLGLGLTTCAVIGLMRRMLVHYREAAVIPPSENKPQYITQDVEDALKLGTLEKLLDSPNYCIQETTAVIVCERAIHEKPVLDVLLWYITRPDHDMREQGIRALTMTMNGLTVSLINRPQTYAALVKSLEYSLTDYEHNGYDSEWDNWHLRDVVEQGCLLVLSQLVDRFGIDGLLKSRFIERWLAKEPWGDSDEERQLNFLESIQKKYRLNDITVALFKEPKGRKALEKARLLPPELVHEFESGNARDVRMINGESTAGEDFDGMFVESRRRRDHSSEDEHLRRRHREAMVLNDGTRPLGRGDIIERER